MQIINTSNGLTIKTDDHIPFGKPGSLCRATLFDGYHQDTTFNRQMMESNNPAMEWNILSSQAYVAPPDFSLLNELGGNKLRCINPNGETDALGCKDHRCIHSYDISLRRNKRTARFPGVQGSVGLDDVVDQSAGHRPERAAQAH